MTIQTTKNLIFRDNSLKKQTKHAMLSDDKITEIYCMADDFCELFNETVKNTFRKNEIYENFIEMF